MACRHIEVVAGSFALVEDKQVLAVVTKSVGSENQWQFYPLVPGNRSGLNYVMLQHALEEAMRFERT